MNLLTWQIPVSWDWKLLHWSFLCQRVAGRHRRGLQKRKSRGSCHRICLNTTWANDWMGQSIYFAQSIDLVCPIDGPNIILRKISEFAVLKIGPRQGRWRRNLNLYADEGKESRWAQNSSRPVRSSWETLDGKTSFWRALSNRKYVTDWEGVKQLQMFWHVGFLWRMTICVQLCSAIHWEAHWVLLVYVRHRRSLFVPLAEV
jgi:hypothetical protein